MKIDSKKNSRGMKHKIREEKKREERIGLAVTVFIPIVIVSVSGFFIHSMLTSPLQEQETSSTSETKAAIVDHLSLTSPNQTFIQKATNTLKQAGYTVDYYPGEEVTVEFYKNLPTHGYKLIIFRVHSSAATLAGKEYVEAPVILFTSEKYSQTKHVSEQLTDQLWIASYSMAEPPYYFAITSKFVTSTMKSKFQNTLIIMMGCEGLTNAEMAKALLDRGAKAYIGWNGLVSASHTDQTTMRFLQRLIAERQTIDEALEESYLEIGPDPGHKSILIYYPLEAGDYTIQNFIGIIITNNTTEIKYTHHREEVDNL